MATTEQGPPAHVGSDLAVEAEQLVKVFGDNRAVDGIDLAVRAGTVYGVLGPNGAGKTTLLKMLATLLTPDGGRARVLGLDVVEDANRVRARLSMTGQFASVDEELTGRENLVLVARLLGLPRRRAADRAAELIEAFGLADASDRLVRDYSGGMRRRLDIAASIIMTPEVLFLDEPTTGLDPRSRGQVWEIVRALVDRGTTVLLTTQYLDEADQLAEKIGIVDHGRVIAEGTIAELKALVGVASLHVRVHDPDTRPSAAQVLRDALDEAVHEELDPAALTVRAPDPAGAAHALGQLAAAGIEIAEFTLGQPSLDEVFLSLTGHPAEPEQTTPEKTTKDAA